MNSPTVSRFRVRSAFLTFGFAALLVAAQSASARAEHVTYTLEPVTGSEVTGHVELLSIQGGGTMVRVTVVGLHPGSSYVSLYYDNHVCELSAHGDDEMIGGVPYRATSSGRAVLRAKLDEEIKEIGSISVRLSSDMSLLACADIRPDNHKPSHR